jgi:hypothetical protein
MNELWMYIALTLGFIFNLMAVYSLRKLVELESKRLDAVCELLLKIADRYKAEVIPFKKKSPEDKSC